LFFKLKSVKKIANNFSQISRSWYLLEMATSQHIILLLVTGRSAKGINAFIKSLEKSGKNKFLLSKAHNSARVRKNV